MQDNFINDLKQQADGFSLQPTAKVWSNVQAAIEKQPLSVKYPILKFFNSLLFPALVLVGGGVVFSQVYSASDNQATVKTISTKQITTISLNKVAASEQIDIKTTNLTANIFVPIQVAEIVLACDNYTNVEKEIVFSPLKKSLRKLTNKERKNSTKKNKPVLYKANTNMFFETEAAK
jgi:hypothetical protein